MTTILQAQTIPATINLGSMIPCDQVTEEQVKKGGNYFIQMEDETQGWITNEGVILPGELKASSHKLVVEICQVGSELRFSIKNANPTVFITGGKVKGILKSTAGF